MEPLIIVNGETMFDFTSVEANLDSIYFPKIKELAYDEELAPTDVYGTLPQKVGRTRGQLKPAASMTMFMGAWEDFREHLGPGFMERVWPAVVHYREGIRMITDTILAARVTKIEKSPQVGSEPIEVKVSLNVMGILWNGIPAVDNFILIG